MDFLNQQRIAKDRLTKAGEVDEFKPINVDELMSVVDTDDCFGRLHLTTDLACSQCAVEAQCCFVFYHKETKERKTSAERKIKHKVGVPKLKKQPISPAYSTVKLTKNKWIDEAFNRVQADDVVKFLKKFPKKYTKSELEYTLDYRLAQFKDEGFDMSVFLKAFIKRYNIGSLLKKG